MNVILITIDCLRKDISYKNNLIESPEFIRFNNFFTNGPITPLAFPALFYSNLYSIFKEIRSRVDRSFFDIIKEKLNYEIIYLNSGNGHISKYQGYGKHADYYEDYLILSRSSSLKKLIKYTIKREKVNPSVEKIFRKALSIIPEKKKFFLFCHLMDLHNPITPKINWLNFVNNLFFPIYIGSNYKFIRNFKKNRALRNKIMLRFIKNFYYISFMNIKKEIELFFNKLQSKSIWDRTLIIVTADHGEILGENNMYGHYAGYFSDALIKIPFYIKFPKNKRKEPKIDNLACHLDVGPSLLKILGIEIPRYFYGKSDLFEKSYNRDKIIINGRYRYRNDGLVDYFEKGNLKSFYMLVLKSEKKIFFEERYIKKKFPQEKLLISNEDSLSYDLDDKDIHDALYELSSHKELIKNNYPIINKRIKNEHEERELIKRNLKALGYF